ncbi:MAG: hypothetical protein KME18_09350 [Phormidium tanganyikae FI6-MK23]|jgi:hypothetical protein|nr:hypothetical protein [Phormidium tanganyikae FI6-MK23]
MSDSSAEPKKLSDLKEGDIVVLTEDPGIHGNHPTLKPFNRPAVEKLAKITLVLHSSLVVDHHRFSRTGGKEQMESGSGGWRIDPESKSFISVPTQEQIDRLPDVDGSYSEAQIRRKRVKSIERLKTAVSEYLDIDSPEISQRIKTLRYFLNDDKEIMREIQADFIEHLRAKNEELKSRLEQIKATIRGTTVLIDRFDFEDRIKSES